jgi:hypothetical protein
MEAAKNRQRSILQEIVGDSRVINGNYSLAEDGDRTNRSPSTPDESARVALELGNDKDGVWDGSRWKQSLIAPLNLWRNGQDVSFMFVLSPKVEVSILDSDACNCIASTSGIHLGQISNQTMELLPDEAIP